MIFVYLLSLVVIPLLLIVSFKLGKVFNLYDYPDGVRKLHKRPILLIGGIFFQLIFIFYFLIFFYLMAMGEVATYNNIEKNYLVILGIMLANFLIGIIDDKKNIKPSIKLVLILCLFFLSTHILDKSFIIEKLSFYHNLNIHLYSYSIIFSSICLVVLLNAINMADGINSLSSLIFINWIFFLNLMLPSGDFLIVLNIILMFALVIFVFFNYQNKCFLGDSGCYVLVTYLGFLTIYTYNQNLILPISYLNIESIFLLFMIPGLDMTRLFAIRIINKKNPFSPDNNHFHHILLKKYGNFLTLIIYNLLIFIPWFIYLFFISLLPYLILSVLIIYVWLISLNLKSEKK